MVNTDPANSVSLGPHILKILDRPKSMTLIMDPNRDSENKIFSGLISLYITNSLPMNNILIMTVFNGS